MTTGADFLPIIEGYKNSLIQEKGLEKARTYVLLGNLYQKMNKDSKATVCYRYAYEEGLRDPDFIEKYITVLTRTGKLEEAESLINEAMNISKDELSRARLLLRRGHIRYFSSDYKDAKHLGEVSLNLVSKTMEKDPSAENVRADAYFLLGLSLWRQGMLDQALRSLQSSLEIANRLADAQRLSEVYNVIGNVNYHMGRLDEAARNYKLSNKSMEHPGHLNNMGLIELAKGRFNKSEEMFKGCIKKAFKAGHLYLLPRVQINLSDLNIQRGEIAKARTWMEQADKTISELNYQILAGDALLQNAIVALSTGELEKADNLALDALNVGKMSGRALIQGRAVKTRGLIALAKGDAGSAVSLIADAIQLYRKIGATMVLSMALIDFAKACVACGKVADARKAGEEARAILQGLGLEFQTKKIDALDLKDN